MLIARALVVAAAAHAMWAHQAPAPGQTPGMPAPVATGVISGVVVDGTTKAPIAGALVTLSRAARQLTDSKGRFAFVNLPPSNDYTISASKFGYFEGTYGRDVPSHAPGGPIPLKEGEWAPDIRVTLWRPGIMTGTVVDESGEPVVGIWVRALAQVRVGGRPHLAAGPAVLTDDRGAYRIPDLRPGRYLVTVPSVQPSVPASMPSPSSPAAPNPPGRPAPPPEAALELTTSARLLLGPYAVPPPPAEGRSWAYPITFHPGSLSPASATTVDVRYGEERTGIDVRLEPVPTSRVSGIVQGPPDALTRLWVRLLPAGLEELGLGSEAAVAQVAPDGSFTLLNVPAGSYVLDAPHALPEIMFGASPSTLRSPSFPPPLPNAGGGGWNSGQLDGGPAGSSFLTRTAGGPATYWGRMTLGVGARDESNVAVVMQPASRMRGRIVWDLNPSQPAPANRPTPRLVAEPATGNPALGSPQAGRSETPDEFTLDGLLAGLYYLRTGAPAPWMVKSVMWNGRDYADTPFDGSAGQAFDGVIVTFTNAGGKIDGQVQDGQGRPAIGAAVIVFPADRRYWIDYGLKPTRIRSTSVSSQGGFAIAALPAGEYLVVAVPGADIDAWQNADFFKDAEARATRVTVGWGEKKTHDLTLGGLRGK